MAASPCRRWRGTECLAALVSDPEAYFEQLRGTLERNQVSAMGAALQHWCACVMRSRVEPMKEIAAHVRRPRRVS